MLKRNVGPRPVFAGITIGGSGDGQPLSLVILTVLVLGMAFLTVYDAVFYRNAGPDPKKEVPFKCTACQKVVMYQIGELRKMQKLTPPGGPATTGPAFLGPLMGPMILDCPHCGKNALTQAVQCPKCGEIFVMKVPEMIPGAAPGGPAGIFDDRCPRCHESYAKAWQEKYRKTHGNE